jgi:hypothetical protein
MGKVRKNKTKQNRPSQQTRFKTTNIGGCNKKQKGQFLGAVGIHRGIERQRGLHVRWWIGLICALLSEAGAVACCGWLAACVYKKLSWLRALFAEGPLGVGVLAPIVVKSSGSSSLSSRRCKFLGRRLQWQP